MDPLSDQKIIDSWRKNAEAWTTAVRQGQIESRKLVTNQAIIDAVLSRLPMSMLDMGCGEGWLARELAAKGIEVLGIDVVPELIERAQAAGPGRFEALSYEAISAGQLSERFDVVVSNFALLGEQSVGDVFRAVPALLNTRGACIVQTIHPIMGCGEHRYEDGWRVGSWDGFNSNFVDPAPWYFRTLESWVKLFADADLRLVELREPVHPRTGKPASALFIGALPD
ncbi:methyltransferase domain-containing protein [Leptolyngbya sp. FACHB-261]|nr:methyltransferase domain-containing protein [Leptolyngbya sp. FACHB-261]